MFQPRTSDPLLPIPGPLFDCASPFASVALVQLASGEHLGNRLQRGLARLTERRKVR